MNRTTIFEQYFGPGDEGFDLFVHNLETAFMDADVQIEFDRADGEFGPRFVWAYTDSSSDIPFLEFVESADSVKDRNADADWDADAQRIAGRGL